MKNISSFLMWTASTKSLQLQPSFSTRKRILVPTLETPRTRYFIWMRYVKLHLTSSQFSEHGSQYTTASTHMYNTASEHYSATTVRSRQNWPIQLWDSGTQEERQYGQSPWSFSLESCSADWLELPYNANTTFVGAQDSGATISCLCLPLLKNLDMTDNNDTQSNSGYRNVNRRREFEESLNAVDSSLTSFRYPFPTFIQCRHRARWRHKAGWTSVAPQTNTLHQTKQINHTPTKIPIRL
jgi:hypothetical protein